MRGLHAARRPPLNCVLHSAASEFEKIHAGWLQGFRLRPMTAGNDTTSYAPLPRWSILAPALSSLACAAVASACCIVPESAASAGAAVQVAFAGFIGWRVPEIFLHRVQDRRLARLASEAVANDAELRDTPIKVTLHRGGVAALYEWIGWYRLFGFVAVLAPESAAPEFLPSLRSGRLQRRVEEVLLHALKRNGWIDSIDQWTLLVAPEGGPSELSFDHALSAPSPESSCERPEDADSRSQP